MPFSRGRPTPQIYTPLAMPKATEPWSLTSLREKLIKIGTKVVLLGRYVTFQMAEVAVPRQILAEFLALIARLRAPPAPAQPAPGQMRPEISGEVCLDTGKSGTSALERASAGGLDRPLPTRGGDLPLMKPVKGAMLIEELLISGEFRSTTNTPGRAIDSPMSDY